MGGGDADARARAGVEGAFARYHKLAEKKSDELYDYDCMTRVELLDVKAKDHSTLFKFVASQRYANLNNVIHGGGYGVLFDMFTMATLGTISRKDYWEFMGGVSRTINISFLRAVPIGTPLWFRCRVVQHGRTMALITAEATNEDGTVVYATCEHHKVNVPMLKEHKDARVPYDDLLDSEARESKKASKL